MNVTATGEAITTRGEAGEEGRRNGGGENLVHR